MQLCQVTFRLTARAPALAAGMPVALQFANVDGAPPGAPVH